MISNTITLRKFFLWNSQWFCDFNYYNLLFEDIKINNYLQSIFKYLKLPTSNFIIKRYLYKLIIQSNIHITFLFNKYLRRNKLNFFIKRHRKLMINHFIFKKSVYFFFKQISYLLYFFIYKKKYIFNNHIFKKLRIRHNYLQNTQENLHLFWLNNYFKEEEIKEEEITEEEIKEESLNNIYIEKEEDIYLKLISKFKDNTTNKIDQFYLYKEESLDEEIEEDQLNEEDTIEDEDEDEDEDNYFLDLGSSKLKILFLKKL